jgi:hypothetical protein
MLEELSTPDDHRSFWLQALAGWVLALVLRWFSRRLVGTLTLAPRLAENGLRTMLAVVLALAALSFYTLEVQDPGSALVEPFPSGAVSALAALWVLFLCADIVEHFTGTTGREFTLFSPNVQAVVASTLIVALDCLAFIPCRALVGLAAAAAAIFWVESRLLLFVAVPAPQK